MKTKKILGIIFPTIIVFMIIFAHDASSKPNGPGVNYYQFSDFVPDVISNDSLLFCVTNIKPDHLAHRHYCIFATAQSKDESQTFLFNSFYKGDKIYWKKVPIPIEGNFIFHSLSFLYDPNCGAQEEFLFSCETEVKYSDFVQIRTFSFNIDTQKLEEK
ncbi:MAG: hypothetical protein V4504_01310 [Patescibacteria group bacterium]